MVCPCKDALGALGLGVNSTAGSRLWKWSGRENVDDGRHLALTDDNIVTQRDGNILCHCCSL